MFVMNQAAKPITIGYRFHLFIFRPVPSSVSSHQALPPTRSPRPDSTFEMDQILQHTKRYEDVTQLFKNNKKCNNISQAINPISVIE
jgi:hypothetical protein